MVEGISSILRCQATAEGQETGTKPVGVDKIRANAHGIGIPDPVVSDISLISLRSLELIKS